MKNTYDFLVSLILKTPLQKSKNLTQNMTEFFKNYNGDLEQKLELKNKINLAFTELKEEFLLNGIAVEINHIPEDLTINLEIHHDVVNNFIYGVMGQKRIVSEYMVDDDNLPDLDSNVTYFPKTYFGDSREGYDVQYFTKNELISDVLKHYDRFLKIVAEESNEMFISSDNNSILT